MSGCNCGNGINGSCSDRIANINMPTGEQGLNGDNGTNGIDGKGYDASSVSTLNILDTADVSTTLTITTNKAYTIGARVRVSKTASPTTNYFEGIVTAYNLVSGIMTISSIDIKEGSGSASAWNINLAGEPGEDGEEGEKGEEGDTTVFLTELETNPTLLNQLKNLLFPTFTVLPWSGDPTAFFNSNGTGKKVGDIDLTGWGLCDETLGDISGTPGFYTCAAVPGGKVPIPALKRKFILAYDKDDAGNPVGASGGELEHILSADNIPEHTHTVTVSTIPSGSSAHAHHITEGAGIGSLTGFELKGTAATLHARWTGYPAVNGSNTDGAHGHDAPTATASNYGKSSPDALDNRPPYFVLAYIIKIDA